jgi:hypothetical protein
LYGDLEAKGITCWYAPDDMKHGDPVRVRIHEEIRRHNKLILVLSRNSVRSSWVESEVEAAFEKERRGKRSRNVLFPIRLDDTVMHARSGWAADVRTRYIGDFIPWEDDNQYKKALGRLFSDLKIK